ncbi:MAG: sugar transferase [Planctomycetota bacterium]
MILERQAFTRRLYRVADLCAVAAAFLAAHALRKPWDGATLDVFGVRLGVLEILVPFRELAWTLAIALPLYALSFSLQGLYRAHRGRSMGWVLWRVARAGALALGLLLVALYLFSKAHQPRAFFVLFGVLAVALVSLERGLILATLAFVRRRARGRRFALIVGTGFAARRIRDEIERTGAQGLTLAGYLADAPAPEGALGDAPLLGTPGDLDRILHERVVDDVFYALPLSEAQAGTFLECHRACAALGVNLLVVPILLPEGERMPMHASADELQGIPLLSFSTSRAGPAALAVKAVADIAAGALLVCALLPVYAAIAFLVKLTSKGPVLFRQRRAGLHFREFDVFKFRTMVLGAEAKRDELLDANVMSGPVFKVKDDPRVTGVGKFLRRWSLDELPQFFNVVRGEMSLVGPRPLPLYEAQEIKGAKRRRLSMKPGVTCLWQISGRNEVDFERWMEMDLDYIDRWSLALDAWILLKTPFAVLRGRGAS